MYKPAKPSVDLVEVDDRYTWAGNEDGLHMHTNCIIAIYTGKSIGNPEGWLENRGLLTMERSRAIRNLDLGKGEASDIKIVEELAKVLGMTIAYAYRENNAK